jgi:two-component system, OmpR family, sensor histidine kinase TctE
MTNQLLMLAQAEAVPTASLRARVDLVEIVASVLEELVMAAQRRDIDLGASLEEHAWVAGSEGLLVALVSNLVDNAIRYTQPGGKVTVTCHTRNERVVLRVIDNGPGIPPEARAHVFERFYRATQQTEGSGLGLPIVQQIARSHGGKVTLAPGPGRIGLVAVVRLPVWAQQGDA